MLSSLNLQYMYMHRSKGMKEDMYHFVWADQRIGTHFQSLHNLICVLYGTLMD